MPSEAVTGSTGKEWTGTSVSSCASAPGRCSIIQGPLAAASTQTAGPGSSLPYRAHSSMKNLTVNVASQKCPSGDTFSRYPLEGHQTSVTQTDPASQGLPPQVSTWVVGRQAPKWQKDSTERGLWAAAPSGGHMESGCHRQACVLACPCLPWSLGT